MDNKTNLLFEDCVRIDKSLYFICRDYNIFCSMNIEDGKISIVDKIPGYGIFEKRLGAKIVVDNDNLYFAPMMAKEIWKYNLRLKEWKSFTRKKLDCVIGTGEMFQAVKYNNKIFFIGCNYPAIIVLNLVGETLEYITEPYRIKMQLCREKKDCFFRTDFIKKGSKILLASCVSNEILEFDLDTYEYKYIEVGRKDYRYSGIGFDGTRYYLAPRKKGPIIVFEEPSNYYSIELEFDKKNHSDNLSIYGGVFCDNGKVIFPACFSDDSIRLTEKLKLEYFKAKYTFYKRIDDDTIVSQLENGLISVVFSGKEYKYLSQIDSEMFGDFWGKTMYKDENKQTEIINETNDVNLEIYIRALTSNY